MKYLLLVEGSVTRIKSEGYERILLLERTLRDSLKFVSNGEWHKKVYTILGEEPPPLRGLKGKVPKYQK
jgi:hypothetical protein